MKSLADVWRKIEYLAGILEIHAPKFNTLTEQDLRNIAYDLRVTADEVDRIRDAIVWE